ncbi:thymidine phosphorylase [bacterium]|nr:thymidine phosphorylase [bacterium]
MRIVDLIEKKKHGECLSKDEIQFFIDSVMDGTAPDYQIAALLMAIYFNSLSEEETANLTESMIKSGDVIDFGALTDSIVDKHSTGGVGDKVTITLIPLLAAAGVPVAKLSGRGLGHTGGTIDKLESIPGFNTQLNIEDLIKQVKKINVAIGAQTQNLTPADGKLYALRDVTATVDSMPLIASSVVSKKIASGAKNIILDVKYGSGAFMKTAADAVELSKLMVNIGKILNKSITAVITSMEEPLGRAVGNSLEIIESIEFLKGNLKSGDIVELTYSFATLALLQLGLYDNETEAKEFLVHLVESGKALDKFRELISEQGGDPNVIDNYDLFELPAHKITCVSKKTGYIQKIDAFKIAYACKLLGAGRERKTDAIDYSVGVYLNKKSGEEVSKDEVLYTIYSNDSEKTKLAQKYCDEAFLIADNKVSHGSMIYKIVKAVEDEDV